MPAVEVVAAEFSVVGSSVKHMVGDDEEAIALFFRLGECSNL